LILLSGLMLAGRLAAQTPVINSLTPPSTTAGASSVVINFTGNNFLPFDPVSQTNGTTLTWTFGEVVTPLPVQFITNTSLRTTVPGSLLTTAGIATITPSNTTGGSGPGVPFVINGAPVITTASPLPSVTAGVFYSTSFAVTGGTPPYGTWTSTTLPPGLSLSAGGVLSGTPTTPGPYTFTVFVPDSASVVASKLFSLTVNGPLTITTASPLPNGALSSGYSQTFAATGGTPPYIFWSVTSGALPSGLSLNGDTGVLSGTPTATGTFNFTVRVTDSTDATGSKPFVLTINPALTITTASPLPGGAVGSSYSQTFAATGGTPPYTNWAVVSGALPGGLTLSTGGLLSGTPTASGTFNFTVRVTDTANVTADKAFVLTISPALTITTASPLPAGAVGAAYSQTFAATGGTPPYTNWAVVSGALPGGLTLSTGGLLSGTPTGSGTFNFTVRVTDTANITADKAFALTISPALTITTASPLPGGAVGAAYSQTFAATGGTPPYTNWAVVSGALPGGVTLSTGGILSGTPTASGTFNFTVRVTDTANVTADKAFVLTISPALTITTASPLPAGAVGSSYSQTFAATGGTPPYTNWAVVSGALPGGLTLSTGGLLSGTPTASGTFNFTVRVTDTANVTADKAFTLTINPALTITTPSPLPAGAVGAAYSQTFAATGGTPPYTNWAVVSGALPGGVTLSTGGLLSGTPTASGTFNFTVRVTDTANVLADKAFALTISPALTITTASPLPGGAVGAAYSQTFAATGGTPPYTNWAVVSGALPGGLTLSTGGLLSGTPTASGTFNFTVRVTDTASITADKAFALTISPALTITTPSPLPGGAVGAAYSQTFAATGGTPPYTNWAVVSGALPGGLTLSTGGLLSGTPTASGTFSFTVRVTDSASITADKAFTLTLNPALTITTASPLPDGTLGLAYSQTFAATGGTPPYTNWSVVGGALPTGVSLSAGGVLSGTPTASGTFNFTIRVTDSTPATADKAFVWAVNPANPVITTASPLPNGAISTAYSQTFAATLGTPPYVNWAVTGGSLPGGLTLSAAGVLSGTPTATGLFNFTVEVTDSVNARGSKVFALTITPPNPTITTASPLPAGALSTLYSQTFAATGGTPPYTNWAIVGGAAPAGLTLSAGGLLSGTPAATGTFTFTVRVTDTAGGSDAKSFDLTINGSGPTITTASPLPAGTVSIGYTQTFTAIDGTPPYSNWSIASGTLPPGLTLSTAGVLTGTPTSPGTFNFSVSVTDSATLTGVKPFQLTVNPAPAPTITTASPLPTGTVGTAYAQILAATGGTPPYTNWAIIGGSAPGGLSLSTGGVLSGTPTASGTLTFTVRVTDTANASGTKQFDLTINPSGAANPVITTATPLPAGSVGTAYSQTFSATGGTLPYTNWEVISGALPGGLSLNSAGLLSGTPNTGGNFVFIVRVTDTNGLTDSKTFGLAVISTNPTITTTSPLPAGLVNTFYSVTFNASDGTPPYTSWSITGGGAPAGLSLSSAGVLSGTPTTPGSTSFTVRVTDSAGASTTKNFALTINQGDGPGPGPGPGTLPLIILSDSGLPPGTVGSSYSFSFLVIGGVRPYRNWRITGGSLPPGLSINADGTLTGQPTADGTFSFAVSVDDSDALVATASKSFILTISRSSGPPPIPLRITTASPLPAGRVGTAYSLTFLASGGTPPYANWTGGGVPGLTLTLLGVFSGTPERAGEYEFDIRLRDSNGVEVTKTFQLTIAEREVIPPNPVPLVIRSESPLPEGVVGTAYRFEFLAEGGSQPYRWQGSAPAGLTINPAGIMSGTPNAPGTYDFRVEVFDDLGATTAKDFRIIIRPLPLTPPTCTTVDGFVGVAYTSACSATGGVGPYTWALVPAIPGLSINANGVISGIPTTSGTVRFTVRVTDTAGTSTTRDVEVNVTPPPSVVIEGIPAEGTAAQQIPFTITLSREYPVDITGVATLQVAQDAVNPLADRAVQFANGAVTVAFTIPARTTRLQLPAFAFQTGTVAGTITVALTNLKAGTVDIVSATPPSLSVRIRRGPPRIDSVRIERSGQSVTIVVTGAANSRQVTRARFRFVKAANATLQTLEATVDVEAEFTRWFRDPASGDTGGGFVYRQAFTIQGDPNAFTSVLVTLTNAEGSSEEKGP
jgi:hypothetical protein